MSGVAEVHWMIDSSSYGPHNFTYEFVKVFGLWNTVLLSEMFLSPILLCNMFWVTGCKAFAVILDFFQETASELLLPEF